MKSSFYSQRFSGQTVAAAITALLSDGSGLEEYQRRQQEFLEGLCSVIDIAKDICMYGCGDTKEDADIEQDRNLVQLLEK